MRPPVSGEMRRELVPGGGLCARPNAPRNQPRVPEAAHPPPAASDFAGGAARASVEAATQASGELIAERSALVRFAPDGATLFAAYREFTPEEGERFRAWSGALSDRELADEVARRREENAQKGEGFWRQRPGPSRIATS